jgi:hypothetical protein
MCSCRRKQSFHHSVFSSAGKLSNDELARLGGAMRPRRYNAGQVWKRIIF